MLEEDIEVVNLVKADKVLRPDRTEHLFVNLVLVQINLVVDYMKTI